MQRYHPTMQTSHVSCHLGEGPIWHAGYLSWIDLLCGHIWCAKDLGGFACRHDIGAHIGCALPTTTSAFVVALPDGVFVFRESDNRLQPLVELDPKHHIRGHHRLNDGKIDARGRLWVGSMTYDETEPSGRLYCISGDGQARVVSEGLCVSNGLGWSPCGRYFYHIDTPTDRIRRFDCDLASAQLSRPVDVVDFNDQPGHPDGMCVDADGMLWVAHWSGGCLSRWNPETGQQLARVYLPVGQVTSCCLGGPDLSTLYVTTASHDMDAAEQARHPLSGRVFAWHVETPGLPTVPFQLDTYAGDATEPHRSRETTKGSNR